MPFPYRWIHEDGTVKSVKIQIAYRIYFGQIGLTVVLLLCGGDKSTQEQDISQAKKYWRDYERTQSSNK